MPNKLRLSYTKMNFYLTCPKRYYFKYVEKRPFYPSYLAKLGSNIHRTLKDVTEVIKAQGTIEADVQKELFEKQWSDVSKDVDLNLKLKEAGESQIQKFSESNLETIKNTLFLEKSFSFKLEDITLCGYIDRVDAIKDNEVEIIDYKTGSIKVLYPDDIQLNFYALICRDYFDLIPAKLSLYFLRTNEKISVDSDDENIDLTKNLILDVSDRIQCEKFSPLQNSLVHCADCCYNSVCDKK